FSSSLNLTLSIILIATLSEKYSGRSVRTVLFIRQKWFWSKNPLIFLSLSLSVFAHSLYSLF
ncbi:unnamed protein product, partial [Brugia timori]|uniref:NADH-ubiquinone oxidoreductase chain 1 n=1 Tax=Brugia timori TaxID=42155 RepID=A0A0R3Q700_9BILA